MPCHFHFLSSSHAHLVAISKDLQIPSLPLCPTAGQTDAALIVLVLLVDREIRFTIAIIVTGDVPRPFPAQKDLSEAFITTIAFTTF